MRRRQSLEIQSIYWRRKVSSSWLICMRHTVQEGSNNELNFGRMVKIIEDYCDFFWLRFNTLSHNSLYNISFIIVNHLIIICNHKFNHLNKLYFIICVFWLIRSYKLFVTKSNNESVFNLFCNNFSQTNLVKLNIAQHSLKFNENVGLQRIREYVSNFLLNFAIVWYNIVILHHITALAILDVRVLERHNYLTNDLVTNYVPHLAPTFLKKKKQHPPNTMYFVC